MQGIQVKVNYTLQGLDKQKAKLDRVETSIKNDQLTDLEAERENPLDERVREAGAQMRHNPVQVGSVRRTTKQKNKFHIYAGIYLYMYI